MKKFACGDVVPGCDAAFHGASVDDILSQVGAHAQAAHGMATVPPDVMDAVLAHIR